MEGPRWRRPPSVWFKPAARRNRRARGGRVHDDARVSAGRLVPPAAPWRPVLHATARNAHRADVARNSRPPRPPRSCSRRPRARQRDASGAGGRASVAACRPASALAEAVLSAVPLGGLLLADGLPRAALAAVRWLPRQGPVGRAHPGGGRWPRAALGGASARRRSHLDASVRRLPRAQAPSASLDGIGSPSPEWGSRQVRARRRSAGRLSRARDRGAGERRRRPRGPRRPRAAGRPSSPSASSSSFVMSSQTIEIVVVGSPDVYERLWWALLDRRLSALGTATWSRADRVDAGEMPARPAGTGAAAGSTARARPRASLFRGSAWANGFGSAISSCQAISMEIDRAAQAEVIEGLDRRFLLEDYCRSSPAARRRPCSPGAPPASPPRLPRTRRLSRRRWRACHLVNLLVGPTARPGGARRLLRRAEAVAAGC